MIMEKRNLNSSNQAQLPPQFEEVKEEPSKPDEWQTPTEPVQKAQLSQKEWQEMLEV